MPKLNAVDAISPAFQLAKVNLFKPFRWSFWWRVALLGLFTGEMSSGGGCNFNIPSNWPPRQGGDQHLALLSRPFPNIDPHMLWVLIPTLIVAGTVLMLVLVYVSSVLRFVLLEAVLNGQIRIREAWERWNDQGVRYFGFQLALMFVFFALAAAIFIPFVLITGLSAIKGGSAGLGAAVGAVFLFFLAFLLLLIPYMAVHVLAKDFAVPVMALEGTTFGQAWRKVWSMVKGEFGSVLGYFGMKIVLTIGAGVIFGIIGAIVLIVILLPVGGAGFLAVLAGKSAGLGWNLYTITLAVCLGIIVVLIVLSVIALISVPVAMFFPAYALYFFAGRYQPLHDRLFPAPPPAPEPPPAPDTPPIPNIPPDLPPEPSAT